MKLCYDAIGEILKFSNSLGVHMNVGMLCKELRLCLKTRDNYYCNIMFDIGNVTERIPGWASSLRINNINYEELKYLTGIIP
jgi:hypothetical protein